MINESKSDMHLDPIAQTILDYKAEAEYAKRNRMILNADNFDSYHLRQDYSHKQKGQSMEFLGKQSSAVEQVTNFLLQGLMDEGEWFRIEKAPGLQKVEIDPKELQKLTLRQLNKNKFPYFLGDCLKLGQLGSLMIAKVGGEMTKKVTYEAKRGSFINGYKNTLLRREKPVWQSKLWAVRQEDYFPDPTGDGLYEVERIEMDYHDLMAIAKEHPEDYDLSAVESINNFVDDLQKQKKSRETDQNVAFNTYRKRVTIYECWGTLIERYNGKILMDNCVSAITTDGIIIRPPKKNPFWHNESPYVVAPIIRVPHSVWHKAMMDAATKHNVAINELYNLMLDASMMSVFGIKQIRSQWLQDPSQVTEGVTPGVTLRVNNQCPPGEKVLERVDTAALSQDAIQMYNLTDREFQQSSFTSDTRLGSLPQREVKATELVQSNQAIQGVFNGIVKGIEELFVDKLIEKTSLVMGQHMNDLDTDEVAALIGDQRAKQIANMSPEERFAAIAVGHKYITFGLSATLNKIQDYRKIMALLQSIGNSPEMMNDFKRTYSMNKLLGVIMTSLDIDESKLKMSPDEKKAQDQATAQSQAQQAAMSGQGQGGGGQQVGPGAQSQIPQAGGGSSMKETGASMPQGMGQ